MYYRFDNETETYGSFETFQILPEDCRSFLDEDGQPMETGWYWWACLPGCLPDSEQATGPFKSEAEAIADARRN